MKMTNYNVSFKTSKYRRVFFVAFFICLVLLISSIIMVKRINGVFLLFAFVNVAFVFHFGSLYKTLSKSANIKDDEIFFKDKRIKISDIVRIDYESDNAYMAVSKISFYDKSGIKIGAIGKNNFENSFDYIKFLSILKELSKDKDIAFVSLKPNIEKSPKSNSLIKVNAASYSIRLPFFLFLYQAVIVGSVILMLPVFLGFMNEILVNPFLVAWIIALIESPFILYWYLFKVPLSFSLTKNEFTIKYRLREKSIRLKDIQRVDSKCETFDGLIYGEIDIHYNGNRYLKFVSEQLQDPYLIKEFISQLAEAMAK
jgi:hypothetical protein